MKKAYDGKKRIVWFRVYAGEEANKAYGEWLPADTLEAFRRAIEDGAGYLELDVHGLCLRIETYRYAGYFEPAELNDVILRVTPATVTEPGRMLANRYFFPEFTTANTFTVSP